MPFRLRYILRYSRARADCIFFEYVLIFSLSRICSSSSSRVEPIANRAEVRQRAAQPAVAHVRHAAAVGFALHRVGRLPLGADEQHQAVPRRELREILLGPQAARGPSRGRR